MSMLKQFLCQLFSDKCQLISLQLDIPDGNTSTNIHQSLSLPSNLCSMYNKIPYSCMSLRYLHIRLDCACFLEDVIERVPNLKKLSVYLRSSWVRNRFGESTMGTFAQSNETWSSKVRYLYLLF